MKRQAAKGRRLLLYSALIVWGFVCLFPFYWLITTSLKNPLDVSRGPVYFPGQDYDPTLEHWDDIVFGRTSETFRRHFKNSVIAATGSTFFAVIIGSMAGYGLARFKYSLRWIRWHNNDIALWIVSQRFLPPALFVVPFLILYAALDLVDTHVGLIIVYTVFNIPFAVWIMRDFFNSIPIELEHAAVIDGASRWQTFRLVVLPLSMPGLATVALFSFVFAWNEYLYALMLTNFDAITMPVLIAGQNNTRGIQWWFISALTLASMLPVMLLGMFMEKKIRRGLVAGALKG